MKNRHTITAVVANFAEGRQLQQMLNKYARSYDDRYAYWDSFAFTAESKDSADAVLVFNSPANTLEINTDPGKVIAFMMEPGVQGEHPWMFRKVDQYAKVYSPVGEHPAIPSHGFLGWYSDHSYQMLKELQPPVKERDISCIVSGLRRLPGHRQRLVFAEELTRQIPGIDFFGRNSKFINDKMDGLLPYRYSLAMENCSQPHYFTEKINDCFLAWTVPIYFGCSNISSYFPSNSFIQIDINDIKGSIEKISYTIKNDDWQSRLPALREARDLVLEKYQPLAGAAEILREIPSQASTIIQLKPVKRLLSDRIRSAWQLTLLKPQTVTAARGQQSLST